MKKISLLVLFCCFGFFSRAITVFYANVANGDVTDPLTWSTSYPVPNSTHPTPADFASASSYWEIFIPVSIGSGETWTVGGSVFLSRFGSGGVGTQRLRMVGSVAATINIGGSLNLSDTSFIGTSVVSKDLTINVAGNLFVSDHSFIFSATDSQAIHIRFNDNTGVPGLPFTYKQISWTSDTVSRRTSITFDRLSVRSLAANVNLPRRGYKDFIDTLYGTLYCGTNVINSGDSAGFVIADSATIYTAHPGGLDSSLQQLESFYYSQLGNYVYNGTMPQVTGFSLPDTLRGPAGAAPALATYAGTVTINNIAGVTLSDSLDFETNGALNLERGTFVNGSGLRMNSNSWVKVDSGALGGSPGYVFPVTVQYINLGPNLLAVTTGNELLPVNPGTIGLFNVHKNAATITLNSAPVVQTVQIDSAGAYLTSIPVLDASTSNYSITTNQWINTPGIAAFNARGGSVIFVPSPVPAMSQIMGPTIFNGLTLNNNNHLQLTNSSETVNGQLTLTSGLFYLGADTLVLGQSAPAVAPGAFSNSNMIVDNSGTEVRKLMSADGLFLFPVGDSLNYSPVTLNFSGSGAYATGAYAGVQVHKIKHPNNANLTNYLNRYWTLDISSSITAPSYSVSAQYVPGDVTGTENRLSMGQFTGPMPTTPWTLYAPTNTTTHTLTTGINIATGTPPNDFTGIDSTHPTVVSTHDTILCIPGPGLTLHASSPTGDPGYAYSWSPSTGLTVTTGATVSAAPLTSTVYTLTITDGNGLTNTATTSVTVNAAPSFTGTPALANNSPLCVGDSLIVEGVGPTNISTYSWAGPGAVTPADSDVASLGNATTAATGIYTLTVTNGPGANCAAHYMTSVTVNALPSNTITAPGSSGTFCDSAVINATASGTDVVYYQGTISNGTSTSNTPPFTVFASGTYYFRAQNGAGCWGNQDSAVVVINPLPAQYYFSAPAPLSYFCATDSGFHIIFGNSDTGISYQLDTMGVAAGPALAGTGGPLDFGLRHDSGMYVMTATNVHTGCVFQNMDSVLINRIALPANQMWNGDTGFCAGGLGVDIQLTTSNPADSYWLYFNGTVIDSGYSGFGGPIDFGTYTGAGIYTASAKDITHSCLSNLAGHDSVWIQALPNVYALVGGGTDCADGPGLDIKLIKSDTPNISYQLWDLASGTPSVTSLPGTGTVLDFGNIASPGDYIAIATYNDPLHPTISCADTMSGIDTVNVNPLPFTYPVTISGGFLSTPGTFCVNQPDSFIVGLGASQTGIRYQLYFNGTTPVGSPVAGTGSIIDFGYFKDTGTYSVTATDTLTLCTAQMTGNVNIVEYFLANVYTVTGTGSFCSGATGIDIQLSSSDASVTYSLIYGGSVIGTLAGTGSLLDFGIQSGMGTYTAFATTANGCIDTMAGTGAVIVLPLPSLYSVTGGGAHCFPGTSFHVGLSTSDTGVSYQLFKDSTTALTSMPGTGSALNYGLFSAPGNYTVVATRTLTGCKDTMNGYANITIYPLPLVDTVTGNGIFCAGALGSQVLLSGSQTGVSYNLYRDTFSVPVGTMAGTGSMIDFGYQALGGTYRVVATNTTTGCVSNMDSAALLIRHPLPIVYPIAGGGNYCIGGAGLPVYLDGSNVGIRYQLYNGATPVGVVMGTGFGISYGIFPTVGVYNVIATDTATGCTSAMANSVTIGISSLPGVFTVSGGGTGCAGTAFRDTLSGSVPGVKYRLYNGVTLVDSMLGTGGSLVYGPYTAAGTYTAIATDITTLCSNNMAGSAIINALPLPRFDSITGGGSYCAGGIGVPIGNSSSQVGVNYQPQLGGLNIGGPLVGTGSALNFGNFTLAGAYRMVALNTVTGCTDTMYGNKIITIDLLPNQFTVDGGGTYCTLDSGVHVSLNGSDTGITYRLYNGTTSVGGPRVGDDSPLDFGLQTATGTYVVTAVNNTTGCHDSMSGAAVVTVEPIQVPVVALHAFPDSIVFVGKPDTIVASIASGGGTNPTYQWLINNNVIYGATTDTLNFNVYFDLDSIVCQVTSQGPCGGVTTSQLIVIRLVDDAVHNVNASGANIRLMPNPNKGTFTLKGTMGDLASEDVSLEVTDMLGQVVYTSKITAVNGLVNESVQLSDNLSNGMYLLNLRAGQSSTIFHFVVEK